MKSQEIRQVYEENAAGYDTTLALLETISGAGKLRRQLMQHAHGDVLDVACGTGRNFPFYAHDCRITGVDLSPAMLKLARKRAKDYEVNVQLMQQNVEQLEFSDHQFDTVVSAFGVCTYPHPVKAIKEMARVCKHNGRILLLEHGQSNWRLIARLLNGFAPRVAKKTGCRCNREPLEIAEQAQLQILAHRRTCFGILHVIEAAPGES